MRYRLAAGSEVTAPLYDATVTVADQPPVSLSVTAMGDEPLLGRRILDRYRIILDHGRRLTIEP